MSHYRGISLATFFGCAPALDPHRDKNSFWYHIFKNQVTPKILFDFICNPVGHNNGVAKYAPYGLRKVEAALLRDGFKREDVVVAHPDHVEKFIGPETEVVGTYGMDPLGMGPVTMTFTYGRKQISYDEYYCRDLHMKINAAKKKNGSHAKVLAGASGTWQYNYDPKKIQEYGLYAVLEGELGGIAPEIDGHAGLFFNKLIEGEFENMNPNREALEELFNAVMSTGIGHTNPTHGTLAGAIADEKLIPSISRIIRASPTNKIGIQCGFETGSLRLIGKYADRKLSPYKPEEWHWVVKEGVKTLNENHWIPAFTLIMGLDNAETEEDAWDTIRLISDLETEQPESMFTTTPLTFVPIGLLEKSEFFDIGNEMTAAQLGVMYKTWQHNFKYGIQKFMDKTVHNNTVKRKLFTALARTLGNVPLTEMEKFARRKSPNHARVIETIKARYW